ncbi:hypothetical protein [Bacillus weihaiensis]|uniref:hypothetical protein n=1 Tax=Bacillus weihaiensis TaxID=1547283 RepID=UPI002357F16B|nr:hypothetical protein [Bacillus weihaiensis]
MRRRSNNIGPILMVIVVMILLVIIVFQFIPSLGEKEPKEIVEMFYEYEQAGDFGSAWELFHPAMQERFSKNAYVTERSHIYMSHYGVTTFDFELNGEDEVKAFKMADKTEEYPFAYRTEVTQSFKSKFGIFKVEQEVYAVEHEGVWKIMWRF